MIATLVIMGAILALLVAVFVAFFIYSRTPKWWESETRKSLLSMVIVVGPWFGMHYKAPRPELPAVTTLYDQPGGTEESDEAEPEAKKRP